jgi:hypothetical protein
MFRLLRRLVFLGVVFGVGLQLLRRFGLFGDGECGPSCDCSNGATSCRCGHPDCLAPATA